MDESGYKEFRDKIKKVSGSRKHKITNSYGVYDYYKYYRKNKPSDKEYILTESQYFSIIRTINDLLAKKFFEEMEIKFPCRMGKIELRKYKVDPRIVNGKLVYNAPIDWDKTTRLWYEDPEAFKNKTLVKSESREFFKCYYNKIKANFKNKTLYSFRLNKFLKLEISRRARENTIDAFTLK